MPHRLLIGDGLKLIMLNNKDVIHSGVKKEIDMNTRKLQKGRGREQDFNFFTFTLLK